jgi:2,5-diamino-6-(ribosylamino)-4(3H)-pyrimidinone 5'-phosphate reductase
MSADGKIALPNKKQLRISSNEDIRRVHQLRNSCDAILVGIGAVLSDDPKLTVKQKYVEKVNQPLRIVLDSECKTPINALVVNNKAKTIIFTKENYKDKKTYPNNVEIISVKTNENGQLDLYEIIQILQQKKIQTLLIEGGGTIIWNFLQAQLVDEIYVYIGPIVIGGKNTPTMADGMGITSENEVIELDIEMVEKMGKGILIHYVPKNIKKNN